MTPHEQAWPPENRLQMMKTHVRYLADDRLLHRASAAHIAPTYRLTVAEVEAEMMRHLHEGGDK